MEIRSVTGLHVYYYFGHLCDYQLHRTVFEKKPPITSPGLLLLLEQGRRNEDLYVERLRERTQVVSFKDPSLSMEERAAQTLAAMREGVPVIHNGVLDGGGASAALSARYAERGLKLRFRGETDLLIRVDGLPSAFGDWSYRVADVKSSRTSKFPQMMQVAYYDWLLRGVQGGTCGRGEVVVFPNGPLADPVEELFELPLLEPALTLFLEERLGDVLARPRDEVPYHLTRDCRRCLWHEHCRARAEGERDLSLVTGLKASQKRALWQSGVATVEALAEAADETLAPLSQTAGEGFLRARSQARAYVTGAYAERAPLDVVVADWLAENERDIAGLLAGGKQLPVFLTLDADALTSTAFSYGVAVGEHPPQIFGVESAREEELAFFRFCEGMERVRDRTQGRYAVFHFGGGAAYHLQRLQEKYQRADMAAVAADVLKHMVDLRAILLRAFFSPAPLDAPHDAMALFAGGATAAAGRGTLADLTSRLEEKGIEPQAIEASFAELGAAAARIGVTPEALLNAGDDDLTVVYFRMYLERQHPLWLMLIEDRQAERLKALRAVANWLLAQLGGETAAARKAGTHV